LNRANIDAVLIKGWAAARLYPEIGVRPYGDLDICVRPRQLRSAMALLGRPERRINIDLHAGFSELDPGASDELDEMDELMGRSETARIGTVEVRLLCAEDHLRILSTHALKHGMCRAIWLCDIGAAVESRPAGFDWDKCLGENRRVAGWVRCAIALAGRLLDARIDSTPAASRMHLLPRWLISQVLKSWSLPNHNPLLPFALRKGLSTFARDPRLLVPFLKERWPDGAAASIAMRAPINEMPRLPLQLGYFALRSASFIRNAVRASRS
jgi:hypothetical protein